MNSFKDYLKTSIIVYKKEYSTVIKAMIIVLFLIKKGIIVENEKLIPGYFMGQWYAALHGRIYSVRRKESASIKKGGKNMVKTNVLVIAVKNFRGKDKLIDYYLVLPDGERIYAFSRRYTDNTYKMCRGGVRLNDLLTKKSHDTAIMYLVKRMKFLLPYLKEEYQVA